LLFAISAAAQQPGPHNYGRLPLVFEPNQGQADASVMFLARADGYMLFLTEREAVLGPVRMRLAGAAKPRAIRGLEPTGGISNYFIGNDPAKWRTGIPHYSRVEYKSVYAGVDVVYYGNPQKLEYDLIVAPGALGGSALTVAGLTPGSGIGAKQAFTLTFRDPSAATNITNAQLLINADLNGSNACYLGYVRAMNLLYLVSDLGSGLEQPPITPNTGAGTAQNSQCILSGEGTTANISGTDLTLTINLTFKAGFAGGKVVYAAAQSGIGGNSGWQARGVWVAP